MLDNESWKNASAELIQDQQVRDAVSIFLVSELYESVDVATELEAPRVQQLGINANAVAQQKLVNVLEDKTGNGITTGDGVVTLDLSELVTELGTDLGLSDTTLAKIPPDTGVITVMRSDQLSAAQAGVQVV